MSVNSKEKGKRGELELAALLRDYGFTDAKRGQQYHGGSDSPDIVDALPGIHIECKRVEKLNIVEAMAQADRDCGDNIPAVFHRRNRTPWLVTIHLDNFMELYKRWKNESKSNGRTDTYK